MPLTLESSASLSPQVALRPEPFGALAYHYGNRRLACLKHPDVGAVVKSLGQHPTVGATLDACGIAAERRASFLAALDNLTKSEIIHVG